MAVGRRNAALTELVDGSGTPALDNEIELMLRHVGFSDIEVTAFGEDRPPEPWNDVRIAIHARRP